MIAKDNNQEGKVLIVLKTIFIIEIKYVKTIAIVLKILVIILKIILNILIIELKPLIIAFTKSPT